MYQPLLSLPDAAAYEAHFMRTYCKSGVLTFDKIRIRFRPHHFKHAFYESPGKTIFSKNRAERMDWIAAALADAGAPIYFGWDSDKKRSDKTRRVTLLDSENYVVVVQLFRNKAGEFTGEFRTAFLADGPTALKICRLNPRWTATP